MKKFNKILSIVLAVVMLFTAVGRVNAENEGHNYTPLSGSTVGTNGKITINKYLVITGEVDFPAAKFDYQVTYPTANAQSKYGAYIEASPNNPIVYPGPQTIKVSTTTQTNPTENRATLTFDKDEEPTQTGYPVTNNDSMFNQNTKGSAEDVVIEPDQKYIRKDVILDFSGVTFTEPGVYRFWLEEIPSKSNPSYITNDAQVENEANARFRTIDVYIVDDTDSTSDPMNKKLKFDGVVVYEGKLEDTAAPNKDVDFTYDITDNKANRSTSIINDTWTTNTIVTTYLHNTPGGEEISEENWNKLSELDKMNYLKVERTTTVIYSWDADNSRWNTSTSLTTFIQNQTPTTEDQGTGYVGINELPYEAVSSSDVTKTYKDVYDAEYQAQYNFKVTEKPENTAEAGEKNVAYVNEIEFHNLTVKKTVKGNQGSTDKYFKFTIEITNAGNGTILNLNREKHDHTADTIKVNLATNKDYTEAEIEKENMRDDNGSTDPDGFNVCTGGFDAKNYTWQTSNYVFVFEEFNGSTQWVRKSIDGSIVDTVTEPSASAKATDLNLTYGQSKNLPEKVDGKVTIVVFLQHGEELTIEGLPRNAKYTVTEEDANTDGYTTDVLIEKTNLEETEENKTVKGESGITYQQNDQGKYYLLKDDTLTTVPPVDSSSTEKYRYDSQTDTYTQDDAAGEYYKDVTGGYQKVDGPTEDKYQNLQRYSKEITVEFENERSGVIPTGVFVAAGTGFAILGAGIVGMLALSRRKDEDEDEE